jgi:Spy/CpxP family protein refolding chaperone
MKNMKWYGLVLAGLIAAGGIASSKVRAAEGPGAKGRGAMRAELIERAKEKLGLTEEQVTQIRGILQTDKENLKDLLTRLHEARGGLRSAIQATDASESSVRTASAKVAAVEADLAVERFKLRGKLLPVFTTEQREKLREFHARIDMFIERAIERFGERLGE